MKYLIALLVGALLVAGFLLKDARDDAANQGTEITKWRTEAELRDSLRKNDMAILDQVIATKDTLAKALTVAVGSTVSWKNEAIRLRNERANLTIRPSIPGQAPTLGDTLLFCQDSLSMCEQEAALEKQRADSLEQVAQFAIMQMGSFRSDAGMFRDSWLADQAMLRRANDIISQFQKPCYLVKAGPVTMNCPARHDVALWAAAGTLLVTAEKKEQRYVALSLLAVSIVW